MDIYDRPTFRMASRQFDLVDKLFQILENAWTQILTLSRKQTIPMRLAALSVGVRRVQKAKRLRGLFT